MKWDGRNEALAYALKTTFKRRVSVYQMKSGTRCRNTSEQDLRVSERIPLYQYLNSVGLHPCVHVRREADNDGSRDVHRETPLVKNQ